MKKPEPIYLKDYRPPDFLIETVHLHFELLPTHTEVKAILQLLRNPVANTPDAPLVLNGEAMVLQQVSVDGTVLAESAYAVTETHLTIPELPDRCRLETVVHIKPQDNTQLMGLYQSRGNYCTQCEAEGFRRITYYLDRPDVMSRFTTTITADKTAYPYLLSNGNLIETRELEGGRHWVHWEDPSLKPCYLFALVAGDFDLLEDTFQTQSGRSVDLQLYVEKGFKHQADFAMGALQRAMRWDETRWGREYDLDVYMIVAVSDFNMGAMENKGLNIFNTKYVLAQPDTATDTDYVGIEAVIGHEYFHNWTGNRVTCRDWFQITLKEGLTVFRDQCFTEDMTSAAVSRLDTVNIVRNAQFTEDAGPLAHPIRPESYIEINNFYTVTVYRKGSEVIRMVQTLIGAEAFRAGLDLYFERHDGQAVTTEDFLAAMEAASGQDLTQFRRWYSQSGTPTLTVTDAYDADAQRYTLSVTQHTPPTPEQSEKMPFYLPLSVALFDANGALLPDTEKTLIVEQAAQSFVFEEIAAAPVPSLLRGFSAPVHLQYDYTDAALADLFVHDTDAFARWNAGQQLAMRCIVGECDAQMLCDAMQTILQSDLSDASFMAALLVLPGESYLHQQVEQVNVHAIFDARQALLQTIATRLKADWLQVYTRHHDAKAPYVYDVAGMGARRLKNVCLSYLVYTGDADATALAYAQFSAANNMTDRLGALAALNHHDSSEREQALAQFYEDWQADPLVVNKWLHMQATSTLPNTYEKVLELLSHEAFDLHNPNNVYALLCGFSTNATHFHQTAGQGYTLIADQVLALNAKNPQVAARLIQPLTQWRRYEAPYGNLMRAQLARIAKAPKLSSDIYEIIAKSLD